MSTSKDFDWAAMVKTSEGVKANERPVEYQFSKGREFRAPAVPYQSDIPTGPAE
jgi:hypothetical protein